MPSCQKHRSGLSRAIACLPGRCRRNYKLQEVPDFDPLCPNFRCGDSTRELTPSLRHIRIGSEPCKLGPQARGEIAMRRRRPSKLTFTPEERFSEEARRLREEAKLLPPGALRDELIRKARHAEAASHMNGWLTSPGLRPPE